MTDEPILSDAEYIVRVEYVVMLMEQVLYKAMGPVIGELLAPLNSKIAALDQRLSRIELWHGL